LFGSDSHKKDKDSLKFKSVTLTEQGTAAWTREYEVLRTRDGIRASLYEGDWEYNEMVSRKSCRTAHRVSDDTAYKYLAQKFRQLKVDKWDGFSKSDPNVLDGNSFSLEIELAGGSTISAHGSNAYPENFSEFRKLIEEAVYGPVVR
jgi:hypothetical protein